MASASRNELAMERRIRCGGRSGRVERRRRLTSLANTRAWRPPAKEQPGIAGSRRRVEHLPWPTHVFPLRARMPWCSPEQFGSCPLPSPAGTWSCPDAGTRRYAPPWGDTTPRTAGWHSARWPASARWKGQLLETRDARRVQGQYPRHPSAWSMAGKSQGFAAVPNRNLADLRNFADEVRGIPRVSGARCRATSQAVVNSHDSV